MLTYTLLSIGVYRVSRSIISYYDTQIVGEIATLGNMPVIMPTSDFKGNGVFDTDIYLSDGKTQWYLNTVSPQYSSTKIIPSFTIFKADPELILTRPISIDNSEISTSTCAW